MNQRRHIIVRESRVPEIHAWLLTRPILDIRGGGDNTFSIRLGINSAPGSVVKARACNWKLSSAQWIMLRDKITALGWKRNTTDADNDISDYLASGWVGAQVLADTTRKPVALVKIKEDAPTF